ncbi:hypothetical protein NKH47_32100 [Mesorhizobium sp. M1060]|uniref:hypothetical protein n=2 Tax=unclassified Mesorhizobium TaxID=325217 RepID=UPI0003CE3D6B|nr:hypothetical protein [Mesorhizobium sp. LSJC285A00]ESW84839.1 hypothetical protein X773_09095 [Mesorhizobium sp. LSJC285A00]
MTEIKQEPKIAILGWGSLIWDKHLEFDAHHDGWLPGGPVLQLEFSRISESRKGALTLVVDNEHGTACETSYAVSSRKNPDDAVADLRCRESTILSWIGYHFANGSRTCSPQVPETVAPWGADKGFDVVVWTGLASNFKKVTHRDFSIPNAMAHLQSLSPEGKAMAATYIWRAPEVVKTNLRTALQLEPWFAGT